MSKLQKVFTYMRMYLNNDVLTHVATYVYVNVGIAINFLSWFSKKINYKIVLFECLECREILYVSSYSFCLASTYIYQ